jgi:glyoxylase-like metal-dependent hydrolase (beta-lactamase superfamily II)
MSAAEGIGCGRTCLPAAWRRSEAVCYHFRETTFRQIARLARREKPAMRLEQILPDLYLWSDTCNVYVLRDGDAALLIDLGDGSVLEHLAEIGVKRVEWVLFTHHHREQCQGFARLKEWKAQVAAPEAERALFETPTAFRKMRPTLGDAFSVYGASYVRPPLEPIPLDRTFQKMDDFSWRGREFWCLDTRGNSPGGMSYLLKRPEGWIAFSGDCMLAGAKLHTWFDAEWDYGFAKGLYAQFAAAHLLESFRPQWLLPSHGPLIPEPGRQLEEFQEKLRELARHYVRGYELFTFAAAAQDRVSQPTAAPHVWQVTPHLYKFKGPDFWPNFTLLLADSGHGLIIDCGLFQKEFLDKAIGLMQERLGLKQIDAVLVTHMHGDHCQEAPHVREKWGAKLWTMDRVVDKCEAPEKFDYAAPINTYGKGFDSVSFDRVLHDGETFYWEDYVLTVDWMPGQTEFALCLHGTIDGKRVAFTGDNIFASTTDPAQTGHEAVVARNSCLLEEGYLYAANYLHSLEPDLLIGGHSWVMDRPRKLIERYRAGALALREAFQALSVDPDYRYGFDPYWVRAEPYRVIVQPGESAEAVLLVRNFRDRPQKHRIAIHAPPGITVETPVFEGEVAAESTARFPLKLSALKKMPEGLQIVAFDITLDGVRHGELFDMIVHVGTPAAAPPPAAPAKGTKPY